jgi:cobalt/nickel transport system permease protein
LHHLVVERWSRGRSPLHARDARVKILALLSFLIILTTTPAGRWGAMLGYLILLCGLVVLAGLPLKSVLVRAALVLPISATFAAVSLFSGSAARAIAIPEKSFLSAVGVLLLVGTTPLPQLLQGLGGLGAPRMVVLVIQFLYRYLFVIFEQAEHMRLSAQCRGGFGGGHQSRFKAAAGALAVLFGRSYERAEGIHQAMLSRGFDGHLRLLSAGRITAADMAFLATAVLVPVALRLGGKL